ncbi:hypothetical protein TNCV_3813801 [Trichonephila clavipes]|nr:hypothetical protein TNCV_3813801 [Trichonephila clavipes]
MPTWLYRQDFAKFSLNSHYNGTAEFDRRIQKGVVGSIVTTNQHRTWGHKSCLVKEIRKNRYEESIGRLLATDLVTLNHGQVTRMTPELAPLLLPTIPHQREDV